MLGLWNVKPLDQGHLSLLACDAATDSSKFQSVCQLAKKLRKNLQSLTRFSKMKINSLVRERLTFGFNEETKVWMLSSRVY